MRTKCLLSAKAFSTILILFYVQAPGLVLAQFITKGDAIKISEKCYKVTEDENQRFGAVWWKEKIDLNKPLELNFVIFLGDKDEMGADGIGFVFHDDPRGFDAKGSPGRGLGFAYDNFHAPDVIKPSVGIEFDTWYNQFNGGDIVDDHTTVVYDGNLENVLMSPIRINPASPNVENNQCHDYKIKWNPATKELQLYFDGQLRFTHKDDIINKVFKGNSMVYYGFTGSTGGATNEQTVCVYDADSKPVAQNDNTGTAPGESVAVAVLANDFHTTGDKISLAGIINQPKNGKAVITGDYGLLYGYLSY